MRPARTQLIGDDPLLPYLPYWLATGTMTIVAVSLMLPVASGGSWPSAAVMLTAATSALCLALFRQTRDDAQGFTRLGFHAGIVAFFLLMPLLFPDDIAAKISSDTRQQIDLILLVSVLGFEAGYWLTHVVRVDQPRAEVATDREQVAPNLLVWLMVIGVLVWAAYQLAYATTIRANLIDVLLAMRNPIEGVTDDVDFVWRYGLRIAMGMLFLSATAGCVVAVDRRASTWARVLGWGVIGFVTVSGFLTGSRGYFLFAVMPAAVACWLSARHLPRIPLLRPLVMLTATLTLVATWFVMSAVRDVERVEDRLDNPLRPMTVVTGAFDIYSQMAVVVESFPRIIEYQYGASAIPVFFGWVPRSVWPEKPYPFSLVMNVLQGEDLGRRTASLSPGLPAEGYGNFGMPGVLLWVLVLGVFCRVGDDYLRRLETAGAFGLQLAGVWCVWTALIVRGGVAEMFYMGLEVSIAPLALAILASKRSSLMPRRSRVPILNGRLA